MNSVVVGGGVNVGGRAGVEEGEVRLVRPDGDDVASGGGGEEGRESRGAEEGRVAAAGGSAGMDDLRRVGCRQEGGHGGEGDEGVVDGPEQDAVHVYVHVYVYVHEGAEGGGEGGDHALLGVGIDDDGGVEAMGFGGDCGQVG